jgi:hypothetical protein
MSIFPYPVCHQTVTVYRKEGDTVIRRVAHGCYYRFEDHLTEDLQGLRFVRKFLLIQPGENPIYPGDRVIEGEGPVITARQWDTFVPAVVPGLSQAAYAAPWHWAGQVQHWEAGRK